MFANDLAHDIKLSSFSQVIISFLSLRELRSFEWTIQALFNYSFFIVICSLYFLLQFIEKLWNYDILAHFVIIFMNFFKSYLIDTWTTMQSLLLVFL